MDDNKVDYDGLELLDAMEIGFDLSDYDIEEVLARGAESNRLTMNEMNSVERLFED